MLPAVVTFDGSCSETPLNWNFSKLEKLLRFSSFLRQIFKVPVVSLAQNVSTYLFKGALCNFFIVILPTQTYNSKYKPVFVKCIELHSAPLKSF